MTEFFGQIKQLKEAGDSLWEEMTNVERPEPTQATVARFYSKFRAHYTRLMDLSEAAGRGGLSPQEGVVVNMLLGITSSVMSELNIQRVEGPVDIEDALGLTDEEKTKDKLTPLIALFHASEDYRVSQISLEREMKRAEERNAADRVVVEGAVID